MEMAEEEWDRQAARCLEKQKKEGNSSAGEVNDGGIDYDVFFESMFELLDYEVCEAMHASTDLSNSSLQCTL